MGIGRGSCGWRDTEQGVRRNKALQKFTETPLFLFPFVPFFRVARVQRELIIISRFDVRIERKRHCINEIRNEKWLNIKLEFPFNLLSLLLLVFILFFSCASQYPFVLSFFSFLSSRIPHLSPYLSIQQHEKNTSSLSFVPVHPLPSPILPSFLILPLPPFSTNVSSIHFRDRTCRNCTFYSTINISRW